MKHKVFCGNLFTVYLHLSLQKAKKEALLRGWGWSVTYNVPSLNFKTSRSAY